MNRLMTNVLLHTLMFLFTCGLLLFCVTTVVEAKIVFRIGDNLYVMNDDGSGRRKLTDNTTATDLDPRWSPDGRQIAFIRKMDKKKPKTTELFVINADGTDLQQLTDNNFKDYYPSWSPDGHQIAFQSSRSGDREVHVIEVATLAVRQLTFAEKRQGSAAPDWSPDGTQITFERFSGIPKGPGVGFVGKKVYVMSADGQHQRPLQDWQVHDPAGSMQFEPRWSPNGQRILFDDCTWHGEDMACRLTVASIGGTGRIIQDIYDRLGDNLLVSYAGWMENDHAILFALKRLDKPTPNYDLYRYAFDTRSLKRLTREPSDEGYPDWIEGALSVSPYGKLTTLWGEIKQPTHAD